MRILAIDQSLTSTGWALWEPGEDLPTSGSWKLCAGVAARAIGFVELRAELLKIHKATPLDAIRYEQPVLSPTDKLDKLIGLYGLAATIEAFAKPRSIACDYVNVRTWRKVFLGPGYKDLTGEQCKRAAVERCRFYGMRPGDDDEAEAIGILDFALMQAKVSAPWREKQPLAPDV